MGKVEMAKLLTFTLLFVTLALAAVADPDEVAPYDSDAEPRMEDSVSLGLRDDGDAAEVSALDRADETDMGPGDDSLDEFDFDNEAADDLDRAVETELQASAFEDSERRSPVRFNCRKRCPRGTRHSRYHYCRCVPTSRRCQSGYTYQRICPTRIKRGCYRRCVKTTSTSKSASGFLVLGGTSYTVTPRMDNDVETRLSDDALDEEDFDDVAAREHDRVDAAEIQSEADLSDDRWSWPWSKKTKCPSGLTSKTFCSNTGRGRHCSRVKMCVPKGRKTGTLKLGGVNYMVVG